MGIIPSLPYTANPRYNESKEPDDLVRYIDIFVIMTYDERLFIDKSGSQIYLL